MYFEKQEVKEMCIYIPEFNFKLFIKLLERNNRRPEWAMV